MGELYDERRQEPRFAMTGKYRLQLPKSGEMEARIIDLSLNGVLLESTIATQAPIGSRMAITLEFQVDRLSLPRRNLALEYVLADRMGPLDAMQGRQPNTWTACHVLLCFLRVRIR